VRWFRFIWAAGIAWDRADQQVARDFSRWLQVSARAGRGYAPAARAHSETVLRGFYAYHLEVGTGPLVNPFPLDRARAARAAWRAPQPDGPAPEPAQWPVPAEAGVPGAAGGQR
jgi:hypothetical protein